MPEPNRDELLAVVERSPRAAAAHDRAAWVGLFTPDATIEDPVGSRPHTGHAEIERFYDTFIGPRGITFHRDLDIVAGTVVLRDLELGVTMGPVGDGAVTMHIPAFLRYDLRADPRSPHAQWRIGRLRAYWDLPAMMLQFLRTGSRAVTPAVQLSRGLLGNQGLRGTAGFVTGLRRVGARPVKVVQSFLAAAARGDGPTAARALSPRARITLGDDDLLDFEGLVERLDGARRIKTIGAGRTVTVSLDSGRGRAIVFADVDWRGRTIDRARYFPA